MALSIGSMIQIALRLFAHRADIERLAPQVTSMLNRANALAIEFNALAKEVNALGQKIAPELFGTTRVIAPTYDVRWLQTGLQTLGFNPGPIDGKIGPRTTEAITSFQRTYGLEPDGWAGIATEAKLVELLQQRGV